MRIEIYNVEDEDGNIVEEPYKSFLIEGKEYWFCTMPGSRLHKGICRLCENGSFRIVLDDESHFYEISTFTKDWFKFSSLFSTKKELIDMMIFEKKNEIDRIKKEIKELKEL